jgi:hypothetical protein
MDPDREKNLRLFLFEDQVAGMLQMTTEGLARQRREGREPGALGQKVGGRIRYQTRDLIRYLEDVYGAGGADAFIDLVEALGSGPEAKPPTKPPDTP